MKTRCHFWQDDGTVSFDYGALYEDIPDELIKAYNEAEEQFQKARLALYEVVSLMTPTLSCIEANVEEERKRVKEDEIAECISCKKPLKRGAACPDCD